MSKLKWEKKSDTYEVACLENGVDASSLEVDALHDPVKGVRWTVWFEGGYAPTMEEAKLACEAAATQRLLACLHQLGIFETILAPLRAQEALAQSPVCRPCAPTT
jgi:hypothetical protein